MVAMGRKVTEQGDASNVIEIMEPVTRVILSENLIEEFTKPSMFQEWWIA